MTQFITVVVTVLVMLSGFAIYKRDEDMRRGFSDLGKRLTAVEEENRKLKEANRKHLPINTIEDLEHAKAAFILLEQELQDKRMILENLGAWLDRARENKRV